MSAPADTIAKSVSAANKAMREAKPAGEGIAASTLKVAVAEAKAATETHRLAKELEAYTKLLTPTKKLTIEVGNMFHSFAGFRQAADGNWTLNLADGLSSVLGVVERLGAAFYNAAERAVEVGAAGEKTKNAFRLNLGKGGGQDVLDYLQNVGAASKGLYTQEQLRAQTLPLVQQGLGLRDLKKYVAASQDVAARGGTVEGALGALGDVRNKRQIGVGTLEAIGFKDFKEQQRIAKRLGGVGFTPDAALGVVQQRLAINPKGADKINAILLDELAKRSKGGKLGGDAAEQYNSPAAALQRAKNIPDLFSERLAAGGGLDKLYTALNHFTDVITGPAGAKFVDALGRVIDKFAGAVNYIADRFGDTQEADKANGIAKRTQLGGGASIAYDEKDIAAAAGRAPQPSTFRSILDAISGQSALKANERGLAQIDREAKVRFPAGTEAQQFGFDIGLGIEQQKQATVAAGAASLPKANDFIWRPGGGVQIDPSDTVVGFKRGGSLGFGAGSGGGGASVILQIAPGAISVHGGSGSPSEIAAAVLDQIREQAPATLLLSALEQFRDEAAA